MVYGGKRRFFSGVFFTCYKLVSISPKAGALLYVWANCCPFRDKLWPDNA